MKKKKAQQATCLTSVIFNLICCWNLTLFMYIKYAKHVCVPVPACGFQRKQKKKTRGRNHGLPHMWYHKHMEPHVSTVPLRWTCVCTAHANTPVMKQTNRKKKIHWPSRLFRHTRKWLIKVHAQADKSGRAVYSIAFSGPFPATAASLLLHSLSAGERLWIKGIVW